jgi:hypothetical protein
LTLSLSVDLTAGIGMLTNCYLGKLIISSTMLTVSY